MIHLLVNKSAKVRVKPGLCLFQLIMDTACLRMDVGLSEGHGSYGDRPRGAFRGDRQGGFSNGEAEDGERPPRRQFERRSGTGRGNEFKRDGSGRGNWGTPTDEIVPVPKRTKRKRLLTRKRAKKSYSINEFLKPVEGESYYGGRGCGCGGRGFQGGYEGSSPINNVSAPKIEDPSQFPTVAAK